MTDGTTPAAAEALAKLRGLRLLDLSHTLHPAMPAFPAKVPLPFERTQTATLERMGVNAGRFAMSEHMGTHLDAPSHFVQSDLSVERIPPEQLLAPAVVVDVSAAAARDADHRLGADELRAWEAHHGQVPAGCYLLVHSGWSKRWAEPERYLNADAAGVLHHPAVEPGAAELLVARGVLGVGIDTLSVDNALVGPEKGATHKVLHGAGRYVLENLARLGELPALGVLLVIGALPIAGGTGGPARVLAFYEPRA